jgi:hypothetical protein
MSALFLASMLFSQSADDTVAKIAAQNKKMYEEILSAHVKFHGYRLDRSMITLQTKQQFVAFCEQLREKKTPDDRIALVETVLTPESRGKAATAVESWREGKRFRESVTWKDGRCTNVMFDGERELVSESSNKQVDIYNRGGSRRGVWLPRDLRLTPLFEANSKNIVDANDPQRVKLVGVDHDGNTNKNAGTVSVFDRRTGILLSADSNFAGRNSSILFQDQLETCGGGVVMPSYVAEAKLGDGGRINSLQITILVSGEFNDPVGDSVFKMDVPLGWTGFDHRTTAGRIVKSDSAIPDVVLASNQSVGLPPPEETPPVVRSGGWRYWILGAVAIVAVMIVVRRARRG